jgi:hypothetical protein
VGAGKQLILQNARLQGKAKAYPHVSIELLPAFSAIEGILQQQIKRSVEYKGDRE